MKAIVLQQRRDEPTGAFQGERSKNQGPAWAESSALSPPQSSAMVERPYMGASYTKGTKYGPKMIGSLT